MKIKLLFILMPVLLFGQKISYKTITVEPYMSAQNYEHFKRLVLNSSASEAEFIEGFEFQWGYYYTLKVKEEKILPLSDGTRFNYYLTEIVSKEKVPDSLAFNMFVDPLRYYHKIVSGGLNTKGDEQKNYTLSQINDSVYFYMDEVEIEVPQSLQDRFRTKLNEEVGFRGVFTFINKKRIRLKSFK
jgi:hypothetical protein